MNTSLLMAYGSAKAKTNKKEDKTKQRNQKAKTKIQLSSKLPNMNNYITLDCKPNFSN